MSRDEVLIVRQSGENMMNSAIFTAKSVVATHFRHFYGLQNANRYITDQRQEPRCLRNESRRAQPISSIA